MLSWLNGVLVPADQAVVPVMDRGFLYGDGLFETLRAYRGCLFRWEAHLERIHQAAQLLRIPWHTDPAALKRHAEELLFRNRLLDSVLRLQVTRGVGARGYSPRGADRPTVVMTTHPVPEASPVNPVRLRLRTVSLRVAHKDPLARFKHSSRLLHVLAKSEAETLGDDDALLLNDCDEVVEVASGNFFWISDDRVCTAPLASGALPGIARRTVLDLCSRLAIRACEVALPRSKIGQVTSAFVTNSVLELARVESIDRRPLLDSSVAGLLHQAYRSEAENPVASEGASC